MEYIVLLIMLVTLPIAAGCLIARTTTHGRKKLPWLVSGLLAGISVAAWYALSIWARRWSDTDNAGWQIAEWWAQNGKWYFFSALCLLFIGIAGRLEPFPVKKTRIATYCAAILLVVWLTAWRTIPIYSFLSGPGVRDDNGWSRQTVPYTCGPVTLINAAGILLRGSKCSERQAARLAGTTVEGTTTGGLLRAARSMGLTVSDCRIMRFEELNDSMCPAVVFIATVPGFNHAVLLKRLEPEQVVLIDPERGAIRMTVARFREVWYGKTISLAAAPKPAP